MTIADIKYAMQKRGSHFFDRATLKFFGDTMKNFGVYTEDGQTLVYRKNPAKHGLTGTWRFDPEKAILTKVV